MSRSAFTATALLALMLASACLAATEPAPPMTVTHIDGKPVSPLVAIHDFMSAPLRSMVLDTAVAVTMNVHGVDASPPPPPAYDRPYPNVQVVEVEDAGTQQVQ